MPLQDGGSMKRTVSTDSLVSSSVHLTTTDKSVILSSKDFEDAIENHYGTLCTIALSYVPWEHEDMVQEGLAKAWKQRAVYNPLRGSPLNFICSRIKSTCLNRLTYHSATKRTGTLIPDRARTIHEIYEVEEALRGWQEGLEPTQIQRVALSALGFSNAEIGKAQGVSNSAVSSSLKRARERMRGETSQPDGKSVTKMVNLECGTRSKYNQGCRCPDCRKANADYRRKLRNDITR